MSRRPAPHARVAPAAGRFVRPRSDTGHRVGSALARVPCPTPHHRTRRLTCRHLTNDRRTSTCALATAADTDAVLAALSDGYGPPFTREWFRWKHESSPWGASKCFVAVDDGGLLGVVFEMPWEYVAGGQRVTGLADGRWCHDRASPATGRVPQGGGAMLDRLRIGDAEGCRARHSDARGTGGAHQERCRRARSRSGRTTGRALGAGLPAARPCRARELAAGPKDRASPRWDCDRARVATRRTKRHRVHVSQLVPRGPQRQRRVPPAGRRERGRWW